MNVVRYGFVSLAVRFAWFASAGVAQADVSAKVVATDPPGSAVTLGRDEPICVRIAYAAGEPISIRACPYFEGRQLMRYERIVADTARDPASQNLWLFEMLTCGAVSLAIMGALFIARRFLGAED